MDIISNILELFGAAYLGDFSKYMFQSGGYSPVFYVMLFLPLIVAFVYYIVLDHILLAKVKKWLYIGLATAAVATLADIFIAHQKISGYTFSKNIVDAGVGSADFFVYSVLLYFIFSLIFKSFSSRSRNIPF